MTSVFVKPVSLAQYSSILMSSSDILIRVSCRLGSVVGLPVLGDINSPLFCVTNNIINYVNTKVNSFFIFFDEKVYPIYNKFRIEIFCPMQVECMIFRIEDNTIVKRTKCNICAFVIDKVQFLHYNTHGGANMSKLKDLRIEKKMTQQQVADLAGISLRSYKSYENDPKKVDTIKYNFILELIRKTNVIDEENGILEMDDIIKKCRSIFEKYDVSYCYLFGSYAKGKANPASDVDLLISANIKGLRFYGLVEEIRSSLHKKVDMLDINQLKDNIELVEEILKDGVKIYG